MKSLIFSSLNFDQLFFLDHPVHKEKHLHFENSWDQYYAVSLSQSLKESDFYSYCSRKIRDLMQVFPCERIALDAQGGGIAIMEALHEVHHQKSCLKTA